MTDKDSLILPLCTFSTCILAVLLLAPFTCNAKHPGLQLKNVMCQGDIHFWAGGHLWLTSSFVCFWNLVLLWKCPFLGLSTVCFWTKFFPLNTSSVIYLLISAAPLSTAGARVRDTHSGEAAKKQPTKQNPGKEVKSITGLCPGTESFSTKK